MPFGSDGWVDDLEPRRPSRASTRRRTTLVSVVGARSRSRSTQADPSRVIDTAGPVGTRVRALAGSRRLRPLFEVRTRRRLYVLESDAFPAGEISLDETAIHLAGGGAPARIRRVGIRVPGAAVDELRQFVGWLSGACVLQPAALSKYEVGRLSAALEAPPPFQFGPTDVDADASIRAVALSVLRRHFAVMLAKEPGTRLADDIEELHDMRVATRRLRAALSLFEDVLPVTVTKLGSELAWLGRTLGAVRDLDVQLVELDRLSTEVPKSDRAALAALRALLENQHAVARTEMLEALDSRRYEMFVGRFGRTLSARHESRSGNAARPARAIAPDLIENSFRSFRKAGDRIRPGSPATDYHRLRTRGKRARYTLEFLGDLYPGQTEPPRQGAHLPPGHPRAPPGRGCRNRSAPSSRRPGRCIGTRDDLCDGRDRRALPGRA